MLKPIFLSESFYSRFSSCQEILHKDRRPYISVQVVVNNTLWAVPLRSNISHKYAIWTDKGNHCGIDFTKAVVVSSPGSDISNERPYIRPSEFAKLKTISEHRVAQGLSDFIHTYQDAKQHPEQAHNQGILRFSTLQYFEDYL